MAGIRNSPLKVADDSARTAHDDLDAHPPGRMEISKSAMLISGRHGRDPE
jgi:hypothetical protein